MNFERKLSKVEEEINSENYSQESLRSNSQMKHKKDKKKTIYKIEQTYTYNNSSQLNLFNNSLYHSQPPSRKNIFD